MEKYFTKEGLEKLKKELGYLKTEKRKEIAEKLKHAVSFGDLSENAAYEEAKESQSFLETKISELEYDIKNALLIVESGQKNKVQHGSKVTLSKTDKENEKEVFQIVDSLDINPLEGKISMTSPLGSKLFGKKAGQVIELDTLEGKNSYKIEKIE